MFLLTFLLTVETGGYIGHIPVIFSLTGSSAEWCPTERARRCLYVDLSADLTIPALTKLYARASKKQVENERKLGQMR